MAAAFTTVGGGRGCSRIRRWWRWDSKLAVAVVKEEREKEIGKKERKGRVKEKKEKLS